MKLSASSAFIADHVLKVICYEMKLSARSFVADHVSKQTFLFFWGEGGVRKLSARAFIADHVLKQNFL